MRNLKNLTLFEDASTLAGTTYIEFLPGEYEGRCWGKTSVYVDAEHPQYRSLEILFDTTLPDFNPYSFITYSRKDWSALLARLETADAETLPISFKSDFSRWINKTLETHDRISFLGL